MTRAGRLSRGEVAALPVTAPPLTEKLFQRQVVELAKILGWRVYHPFLSKWSERGFPDLTMVRARDRRLLFAELKADKGRLTTDQAEWIDLLAVLQSEWQDSDGTLHLDPIGVSGPRVEVYVWRPADWSNLERVLR